MDCLTCRESLSATMDGEAGSAPGDRVDEHLLGCGACRAWRLRGEELTRSLRVRPVGAVPDLTGAILADAPVIAPPQGWGARGALLGIAVGQIALGLSQLFGAGVAAAHPAHGAAPAVASHLFNESTAWNLALGLGMFWAAFRPRATTGMLPVLAGFVVVLSAYSTHDLIAGTAPVARVLGHGLLVAGLCAMAVVHRRHRPTAPEDAARAGHRWPVPARVHPVADAPAGPHGDGSSDGTPGRPHLRPAGRHRAA